jgi:hypothetical protein
MLRKAQSLSLGSGSSSSLNETLKVMFQNWCALCNFSAICGACDLQILWNKVVSRISKTVLDLNSFATCAFLLVSVLYHTPHCTTIVLCSKSSKLPT